jgi:hypothetical protein
VTTASFLDTLHKSFVLLTKINYLCIVNKNDGIGAQGNKYLLSGLEKFSACPERKKEVANGDEDN